MLDGLDDGAVRHNIANGLRWGPDGWLYGRHGILATSHVGVPGCLPSQRTPLNCCIWRYHPTRKIFEVVCRGTTNPWGMDWNEHGELFFINTVIGHLWHAVPGAHFQRMYGEDDNPHVYQLLGQTADHVHWDTAEHWSDIRKIGVSSTTDQAGGGHAHAGFSIYQGDNWPDRYRGSVFTINFHGRRLNNDTLERQGSGLRRPTRPRLSEVGATRGFAASSSWPRPTAASTSPTGRTSANATGPTACISIRAESTKSFTATRRVRVSADLARLSDSELVALQLQKNDWYVRQSRRILYERAAAGRPMDRFTRTCEESSRRISDPIHQLRALWCLYVTGGASDDWLRVQLHHADEHVRVWAIRLLGDGKSHASAIRSRTLPRWRPRLVRARAPLSGLGAARVAAGGPLAARYGTRRAVGVRHRSSLCRS